MPGQAFKDLVVLITGASRGIGRALALQFADQGGRLALAARSGAELLAVAEECRARGADAIAIPTDIGVEQQCGAAIDQTATELGPVDVLVNNAGISMVVPFADLGGMEPIEQLMRVNYLGAVYCTFHALPHLAARSGRIVNVCSLTGLAGVPTRTGYAASKHAMAGFFDSLRIELAGSGVSVTTVYPGFVETGIRERAAGAGAGRGKEASAGRIMTAERCAALTIRAATRRRRELVMTARGRGARWLRLVAPGLVDRIAARAVGFDR